MTSDHDKNEKIMIIFEFKLRRMMRVLHTHICVYTHTCACVPIDVGTIDSIRTLTHVCVYPGTLPGIHTYLSVVLNLVLYF